MEELPAIVARICGVCPGAHHMASGKAVDAVYGVEIPATARTLRELFYAAHFVHSHIAHFYLLAAPDFIVGPDGPRAERNVLGVLQRVGVELVTQVIAHRRMAQEVQAILAGRATHPTWCVPGGVSKGIDEEQRREIQIRAASCLEFAKQSLEVFNQVVLANSAYVEMILSSPYRVTSHSMGLVDEHNRVAFYDGAIRVVDTTGAEIVTYHPRDYLQHVAEHVEPWSYLKFPYLKAKGWHGLEDGQESGVYQAAPLARLNASDGMATPLAQAEYERYVKTLGGKPVHAILAHHWARLVEMVQAAEQMVELAGRPELTGPEIRTIPTALPHEGVGTVEAPRGTLTHHYVTDERGIVTNVNMIVGTTNNNAPICIAIKRAAQGAIRRGEPVTDGALNRIEMAFRAFDPCFSCATHTLPGHLPMEVVVHDPDGSVVARGSRH